MWPTAHKFEVTRHGVETIIVPAKELGLFTTTTKGHHIGYGRRANFTNSHQELSCSFGIETKDDLALAGMACR